MIQEEEHPKGTETFKKFSESNQNDKRVKTYLVRPLEELIRIKIHFLEQRPK